jgi:hypothetical protein
LPAADGKNYLTDVATAETLLRLAAHDRRTCCETGLSCTRTLRREKKIDVFIHVMGGVIRYLRFLIT